MVDSRPLRCGQIEKASAETGCVFDPRVAVADDLSDSVQRIEGVREHQFEAEGRAQWQGPAGTDEHSAARKIASLAEAKRRAGLDPDFQADRNAHREARGDTKGIGKNMVHGFVAFAEADDLHDLRFEDSGRFELGLFATRISDVGRSRLRTSVTSRPTLMSGIGRLAAARSKRSLD